MLLRGRLVAAVAGGDRRRWRAVIVAPGRSKNGPFYAPAMLREAAQGGMFEGRPVHVFPDVDAQGRPRRNHVKADRLVGRTPLNVVGSIRGTRYEEGVGVTGELVLLAGHPDADDLADQLGRMAESGSLDLVGLSMDASGDMDPRSGWARLRHVASVDVVTDPAAGGRVLHRIAASVNTGSLPTMKHVLSFARGKFPRLTEGVGDGVSDFAFARHVANRAKADASSRAELVAFLGLDADASKRLAEGTDSIEALEHGFTLSARLTEEYERAAGGGDVDKADPETARLLESARREARAATDEAGKIRTDLRLAEALATARLPEVSTTRIRECFAGKVATADEIGAAIASERKYVDKLAGDALKAAAGVRVVESSDDKLTDVLAHMFNPTQVRLPEGVKAQPAHLSFVEFLYQQFGIRPVEMAYGGQATRSRFREAVDSTNFSKVFADALNRAVLAAYNGNADYSSWQKLVRKVPYSDFRTNHVISVGYYSTLPTVAKGGTYLQMTSPSDREETISLAKKGGMESITMEDMLNDDLNLWQTMVQRIGQAAMETAYELVFALIRDATQPTLASDSLSLTSASRSPVNEGTAALSADATGKSNLIASIVAMMKGTGGSGVKKGIIPKYAIIPLEKVEAYAYVTQSLRGGVTGTDLPEAIAKMLGVSTPEPIIDLGTSNTTDWYLMADPLRAEVLRYGTLGGRDAPEIFLADDQRFGSMFTRDQLDLKVRFILAAAAVDFLGIYGNDAAS